MHFLNFGTLPTKAFLVNTGQTVAINFIYRRDFAERPTITKGPLGAEIYRVEFIYFHWLEEELVDNLDSVLPMEMHMVFINVKYNDYDRASAADLGIVVLSYKCLVSKLYIF